jgi:hypothetical protein
MHAWSDRASTAVVPHAEAMQLAAAMQAALLVLRSMRACMHGVIGPALLPFLMLKHAICFFSACARSWLVVWPWQHSTLPANGR